MPKGYSLDAMGQMFAPTYYGGIGANFDLNTLATLDDVGTYYQAASANATIALNYPTTVAGTLEVLPSSGGVLQRYTVYSAPHYSYTRAVYNGTWTDWQLSLPYSQLFNNIFRVGYEIMLSNGADPNTLYPGTVWTLINDNRLIRSATNVANIGETGGDDTITLTAAQLPTHSHTMNHSHNGAVATSAGAHNHSMTYVGHNTNNGHYGDSGYAGTPKNNTGTTTTNGEHTHPVSIPGFAGSTGGVGVGASIQVTNPYRRVAIWRRTS